MLSTACGPDLRTPQPQPDINQLNEELATTDLRTALSRREHFKPLCDEAGYPLVGNLATKGGTTASDFCRSTRGGHDR